MLWWMASNKLFAWTGVQDFGISRIASTVLNTDHPEAGTVSPQTMQRHVYCPVHRKG